MLKESTFTLKVLNILINNIFRAILKSADCIEKNYNDTIITDCVWRNVFVKKYSLVSTFLENLFANCNADMSI